MHIQNSDKYVHKIVKFSLTELKKLSDINITIVIIIINNI